MAIEAGDLASSALGGAGSSLSGLKPKGKFATEHHYVAGAALLFVGIIGAAGSITGALPAMIAGLFDPQGVLYTTASGGTTPAPTPGPLTGNAKIIGTSNPNSTSQAIENFNSPAQIWKDLKGIGSWLKK